MTYQFSDIALGWGTGTLWGLGIGMVLGFWFRGFVVRVSRTEYSQQPAAGD